MTFRAAIISRSCATSDRSWPTSEVRGVTLPEETAGEATSITLSARVAGASNGISPDEARTMRTWLGRRWRNSCLKKVLSGLGPAASPKSCCRRRRSCEGVRSPSSSAVNSWRRRCCSEAAVRLMSWARRMS